MLFDSFRYPFASFRLQAFDDKLLSSSSSSSGCSRLTHRGIISGASLHAPIFYLSMSPSFCPRSLSSAIGTQLSMAKIMMVSGQRREREIWQHGVNSASQTALESYEPKGASLSTSSSLVYKLLSERWPMGKSVRLMWTRQGPHAGRATRAAQVQDEQIMFRSNAQLP